MTQQKNDISNDATLELAFDPTRVDVVPALARGAYSVTLDGRRLAATVLATSARAARQEARAAYREAFESAYNQALIFRGVIAPGDVSRTHFVYHVGLRAERASIRGSK